MFLTIYDCVDLESRKYFLACEQNYGIKRANLPTESTCKTMHQELSLWF